MEKIVEIDDLFKIYFLWGKQYYIELMRPLEQRDFMLVSPIDQSIRFLTDCDWNYKLTTKTKSNGDSYSPVYKATQTITLKHKDLLTTTLHDNLTDLSKGEVTNLLGSLYSLRSANISIKYNYGGCNSSESRSNKNSRMLSELETKVENTGENKLAYMYTKHIEDITTKIAHYNHSYVTELKRAIGDNNSFHDSVRRRYSSSVNVAVDEIISKREEIKKLEEEIKSLSESVEIEHKDKMNEAISAWGNIPEIVKSECKTVTDNMKVYGVSSRGLFNNRDAIFIRKPEEE